MLPVSNCVDRPHNVLGHNAAFLCESYEAINLQVMSATEKLYPSMVALPAIFRGTAQRTNEPAIGDLAPELADTREIFQHHLPTSAGKCCMQSQTWCLATRRRCK